MAGNALDKALAALQAADAVVVADAVRQAAPGLEEQLEALGEAKGAGTAVVLLAARAASGGTTPRLSAVLQAAGITLDEAVRELPAAAAALEAPLAAAGLASGAEPLARQLQLRELQQAYVLLTLLAKKTRDLFAQHLTLPADSRQARSPLGFLWLLFCTARASLAPLADLVTSFALLLACLHAVLLHMPPQHRRGAGSGGDQQQQQQTEQQQQQQPQQQQQQAEEQQADALLTLAAQHSAAEHIGTVRQLSSLLQLLAQQILLPALGHAAPQPAGGGAAAAAAAAAGAWPITGLFDAAGEPHAAAVQALQQHYAQVCGSLDLDPASFLAAGGPPPALRQQAAGSEVGAAAAQGGGAAQQGAAEPMAVDGAAAAAVAAEPAGPDAAADQRQQQGRQQAVQGHLQAAQEHAEEPEPASPPAANGQAGAAFSTPSPAKRPRVAPRPPQAPPATPISTAVSCAAWLRGAVAGQPEGPSQALQELMRSAGVREAAEGQLVAAARGMAEAVFATAPSAALEGAGAALELSTLAARRSEGLRLYWLALERLVAAEAARPGGSPGGVATLLGAPLFHRCVAACAFEVVVGAYRMGGLAFPAVLERLRLPAFELCKGLDAFVQQLPGLSRDLKRHMLAAEERCLERLAWQPGSSLYPALAAAVGAQGAATGSGSDASVPAPMDAAAGSASGQQHPARQQRPTGSQGAADSSGRQAASEAAAPGQQMQAAVAATPNGADAEDAASMDEGATSVSPQQPPPVQQRPAQQQPAEAHGAQPGLPLCLGQEPPAAAAAGTAPGSGGSEPQREVSTAAAPPRGDRAARAAVADFLRRVLKLAAIRLADLVGRLDTEPADPQQLLAEAYTLVRHVAFDQTWLLYGRHLDQALLCCAYAVCKVRQLARASFKSCIAAYKQQPQARPDVYKGVRLAGRDAPLGPADTGDIIAFYNQVFIPAVKPFLMRLVEEPALLAQPPVALLPPHLHSPARAQQLAPGASTPPPPWGAGLPASLQTPGPPLLAGWQSPARPPRGLATPSRPGSQLLSPGVWRISRGGTTPLPSPAPAAPLPILPPLSIAALQQLFGPAAGGAGAPAPVVVPVLLPAAGAPQLPALAAPQLPPAPPLVSDAAVQAMFAGAEQAAAAAAAAVMQGGGPRQQAQQASEEEDEQSRRQLERLPSESLPLLAAAAEAAAEIEAAEAAAAAAAQQAPPAIQQPQPQPQQARRVLALQPAQ